MRVISYETPSLIWSGWRPRQKLTLETPPATCPFTRIRSRSSCFGHFVSHQTEISVTVSLRSTYHYLWSNATQIPLMHHYYPIFIPKPPESDHYTTPTPSFPIFRDFPTFPLNFERDFCIRTPIFRWTPLPKAIPSRRISPIFGHFLILRDPHATIPHHTSTQNNQHAINIEPPQIHIFTSPHLISTK